MIASIVGFTAGVWWLQQQAHLPGPLLQGALLLAVLLLLLALRCLPTPLLRLRPILCCLLGVLLGVMWASWRAEQRLAESLPAARVGQDVRVSGRIISMPQRTEHGWRFEFAVDTPEDIPPRIALAWYNAAGRDAADLRVPPLQAGQHWQLTVKLKPPHGNLNPHGFDYAGWLFERGVRATGYVRPRGEHRQLAVGVSYSVEQMRQAVRSRFEQTLGDAPYAGVLVALAIGDQQAVPRHQWDVFARTGITHLVSISGLHITMLAGLAYALCNFVWRRLPRLMLYLPAQRAAVLAGLLVAFAYCLLAGFAVPAQRTLFMLLVVATALWRQRNPAAAQVLALALLLVLLLDPWAVVAPGFWLSFAAVAMLFYVGSGRHNVHWLRQWGRAQWAMSLGLLPILPALFQQFSLVSPLANAVAIPLMSLLITPLALLAAVPALSWLLYPAHALLSALMWLMETFAASPYSAWQQAAAPAWLVLLGLAGGLWLLLPRGLPARWLGIVPLLALLNWTPVRPAVGDMRATVLDVGQGLAVHVQTAQHDLLFDSGPAFSAEADSGNRIILPYLRAVGVTQLDQLIITHADADHAGGAESVVDGLRVANMLSSVPFESRLAALPLAQQPCVAGQNWTWDGVSFSMLHPQATDYARESGKSNDMSCVLKISTAHHSLLLTADIEARSEAALLSTTAAQLRADVMLVPHHGSRTSSTPAFIEAVNAHSVIIPVGYHNRFRHPHAQVLARYMDRHVYRTDRDGALRLEYSTGGVHIASVRSLQRRYWHAADEP